MKIDPALIERAAAILRNGGLVAFPTETVYGLGANALDEKAVRRIYEVKGRPRTSPLILHVCSLAMAKELTSEWPVKAETLARRYWPGPLTLVLPKSQIVSDRLTAGLDTVGIRMPDHPVALAMIKAAGVPVAAPSANLFTALSPTTAAHVVESLGDRVDLILDGGPTKVGIESTVLGLAHDLALLLRPGMLTRAELEESIGPINVLQASLESGAGAQPSPGMHARHYSPLTPMYLIEKESDWPGRGHGVYFSLGGYQELAGLAGKVVMMPQSAKAYAAALYEQLHEQDRGQWDWIGVELPVGGEEWDGVLDRLKRAAKH